MPEPESAVDEIALFPLHTVLFPGGPLPLRIFEARYIDMVRRSLRAQTAFGVVLMEGGDEAGAAVATATIGTSARIADFYSLPDGLLGVTCLGARKFHLRGRRVVRGRERECRAHYAALAPASVELIGSVGEG